MDSSKIHMGAAPKTVNSLISSIVKRITSKDFFLVWSAGMMCFRKSSDGKVVTAEIYPYHGTDNARKLIYELKRRLYLVLEAKIY